ncbi:protein eva-1 isoform X1 [Dermacentor silvarum]|uniref:protein eva-1 isoform X1 n=1 Tax=Dermacentor silvarum TaxID=543639 RepID=UPI0021010568|nr:protein eva-1 isoform X1 [Dermacentor silvarum]
MAASSAALVRQRCRARMGCTVSPPLPLETVAGDAKHSWIRCVVVVLCLLVPSVASSSHLPLLSGTLKTFQKFACDGQELQLRCFRNTSISISVAQYGRSVPYHMLCPPPSHEEGGAASARPAQEYNGSVECIAKEALRVVEAACREKEECTVKTDAKSFMVDPCPGVHKYAEVAFKCRPTTFSNRIVCENDVLNLRCHKNLRIVIYSANFGGTEKGVPECPQRQDVKLSECQVSYATETVLTTCHGRRKCTVAADMGTFGNPSCHKDSRLFLKVVYTCVPKEILKDLDIGGSDSAKDKLDEDEEGYVEEARYQPSTFSPAGGLYASAKPLPAVPMDRNLIPVPTNKKSDVQSDRTAEDEKHVNCTLGGNGHRAVGFVTEWVAAYKFIRANKEKFILYVTLSVGCGVVAFLVVLSARLYVQRRRDRQRAKAKCSEPLSCSFDDSDGGGGGDQFDVTGTAGRHAHTIEVVRYANRSGMRRQDSDTNPRAPMSRSMNNYYYS